MAPEPRLSWSARSGARPELLHTFPDSQARRRPFPSGEDFDALTVHPPALPIEPRGPLEASLRVPGSKSITNRALVMAGLANGVSDLSGALLCDDTQVMGRALEALGARARPVEGRDDRFRVTGVGARLLSPAHPIDAGSSGTTARFLTAVACLASGPVEIDGSPRMRERPIEELRSVLFELGARVEILGQHGCPPLRCLGGGLPGGEARIDARRSSQFVSAVLLAAPYAERDVWLRFLDDRLVSRPYVDLTLEVMRCFGAEAGWTEDGAVHVRAGRPYVARDFVVEPDASAAVYPFCAAAIAGGQVVVEGLPEHSAQADFQLLGMLERMGCRVHREAGGIAVCGPADGLRGLGEVDMNALPDAALALAVVAAFADGPTRITNVANLRIKETDRLAALETELTKLGAHVVADRDSLEIEPRALHGAEIETYDDHRMAMAFSLAGLRVPGVVIRDPACVSKTWPNFFDVLTRL